MQKQALTGLFSALIVTIGLLGCGNTSKTDTGGKATATEDIARQVEAPAKKVIVFFGNSLTAGYGVEPEEAFPGLLQQRIDSLALPYTIINAGLSGETTASGRNRVGWVVGRQPVDIFVLELGGNDGLRGIPSAETQANLEAIIDTVRLKHPGARMVLAGMMVPPNMGESYAKGFRQVFPAVAQKKQTLLIPFLLEQVGGVDSLNLPDGIHPTPAGHKIVAETVWQTLEPLLKK
ncbi:MAG: arylesterase [Chitinophagaceae bacterium]|nr:arylesterase [Chitinophagaceae bacterium]